MHAPDLAIWHAFHERYGSAFDAIEYDVKVGLGRDPEYTQENNIRQMAVKLSKRRIDAVAHIRNKRYIFEVTDHCSFRAIGQALVYQILYDEMTKGLFECIPIIICQEIGTDIHSSLESLKLSFYHLKDLSEPHSAHWHQKPQWAMLKDIHDPTLIYGRAIH